MAAVPDPVSCPPGITRNIKLYFIYQLLALIVLKYLKLSMAY